MRHFPDTVETVTRSSLFLIQAHVPSFSRTHLTTFISHSSFYPKLRKILPAQSGAQHPPINGSIDQAILEPAAEGDRVEETTHYPLHDGLVVRPRFKCLYDFSTRESNTSSTNLGASKPDWQQVSDVLPRLIGSERQYICLVAAPKLLLFASPS